MKTSYLFKHSNYLIFRAAIAREQKQFIKIAFAVHLSAAISAERYRSDSGALKSAVPILVCFYILCNNKSYKEPSGFLRAEPLSSSFEDRRGIGKGNNQQRFEVKKLLSDKSVFPSLTTAPIDDEAKKHNENLPGMGGVYNTVNLHVYHYAGYSQRSFELYNPVKYTDPDGKQTKGPDLNLFRKDSAHYRAALKLPNTFDRTFVIAGHGNVNGVFDHRDDPPGVHRLVNKTSAKDLAIMITNNKMFNIKKRSNNGKTPIIMLYACNTGFTDADKKIYAQELANELANILNDDVIVKTPAGLLVLDNRKEFFKVENNKKPMIGDDAFIKFIGRPNKEIQE